MDEKERNLLKEWEKGFGGVDAPGDSTQNARVTVFYNSREIQCEAVIKFSLFESAQDCVKKLEARPEFSEIAINPNRAEVTTKIYFNERWDFNTILRQSLDKIAGALHAIKYDD